MKENETDLSLLSLGNERINRTIRIQFVREICRNLTVKKGTRSGVETKGGKHMDVNSFEFGAVSSDGMIPTRCLSIDSSM